LLKGLQPCSTHFRCLMDLLLSKTMLELHQNFNWSTLLQDKEHPLYRWVIRVSMQKKKCTRACIQIWNPSFYKLGQEWDTFWWRIPCWFCLLCAFGGQGTCTMVVHVALCFSLYFTSYAPPNLCHIVYDAMQNISSMIFKSILNLADL